MEEPKITTTKRIELSRIRPNPFCIRLEPAQVAQLSTSIEKYGLLSPITVRISPNLTDSYEIVFGHRRFAAVKSLNWNSIPATITDVSDEQMILFALTENLEREAYTDYEIGLYLRKLKEDFSQTIETIAKMVGRSKAYVSDHISMTHLFDSLDSEESRQILQHLSERQARILARLDDPHRRLELARLAVSENLGVKELDKLVGHPRQLAELDSAEVTMKSSVTNEEQNIRSMIEEIIDALKRKDLSRLNSCRLKNLFSLFDEFPPLTNLLLNYEEALEHNWNTLKQMEDLYLDYNGLKICVLGKFGYATFFLNYRMRFSGKWSMCKSRVTFVLTKDSQDRWMIIHEHWSLVDYSFLFDVKKAINGHYTKESMIV